MSTYNDIKIEEANQREYCVFIYITVSIIARTSIRRKLNNEKIYYIFSKQFLVPPPPILTQVRVKLEFENSICGPPFSFIILL